jgi:hypothetical protein
MIVGVNLNLVVFCKLRLLLEIVCLFVLFCFVCLFVCLLENPKYLTLSMKVILAILVISSYSLAAPYNPALAANAARHTIAQAARHAAAGGFAGRRNAAATGGRQIASFRSVARHVARVAPFFTARVAARLLAATAGAASSGAQHAAAA